MVGRRSRLLLLGVLILAPCCASSTTDKCSALVAELIGDGFTTGVHAACEHRGYYYIGGLFNTAGELDEGVQNFARYNIANRTWEALPIVGPNASFQFARKQSSQPHKLMGAVMSLACPADREYIFLGGFFNEVQRPERGWVYTSGSGGLAANGFARFSTHSLQLSHRCPRMCRPHFSSDHGRRS